MIIFVLRLLLLLGWLLPGVLLTLVLWSMRKLGLIGLRRHLRIASGWYGVMLWLLRVRVHRHGPDIAGSVQLVSNHISWLDILVIGSQTQCCFVSKSEVRRWPVIGFLAASVATVFLRRGQGDTQRVLASMLAPIEQQVSVLFFPEGTTTDGSSVRTFHRRLFALAAERQLPVQPLALRYRHPTQPHPRVPYINQQTLWANLQGLLTWPQWIEVDLYVLPVIAADSRNELARLSQQAIAQSLAQPD